MKHPDWTRFEDLLAKLAAGRAYWEDLRRDGAPLDERAPVVWQLTQLRDEIAPLRDQLRAQLAGGNPGTPSSSSTPNVLRKPEINR